MHVEWYFLTDVSGQPIGPTLKGQVFLDYLTLEDGTDRLSRNVCRELLFYPALNPKRAEISSLKF